MTDCALTVDLTFAHQDEIKIHKGKNSFKITSTILKFPEMQKQEDEVLILCECQSQEASSSPCVSGQPGLHRDSLSQIGRWWVDRQWMYRWKDGWTDRKKRTV